MDAITPIREAKLSQEIQTVTSSEQARDIPCDALVVGCLQGEGTIQIVDGPAGLDAALDGHLAGVAERGYKAKIGELALVPTLGRLAASSVALVGLGRRNDLTPQTVRRAAGAAARALSGTSELVSLLHLALDDRTAGAQAATEGFLLGSYSFGRYKAEPSLSKIARIVAVDADEEAVERGAVVGAAVRLARDLTNEPASALDPETLARRAKEIADVNGLACEIFDEKDLADRGFGGLLGVAQGSPHPPRLIHLSYAPDGATGNVALVGKGITFDSGGLSLKPPGSMEDMKTDMAGAAAVLAAIQGAAKLKLPLEIHAYIPSSENMPDGSSLRPGDVITHYGGRTTEVNNTDAEGRLVLIDAITYACERDPEAIFDLATLTGGVSVALGKKVSGLLFNDEALRAEIEEAAGTAGEDIWALPLFRPYISDLESDVADFKNSGTRYGSAIIGGLFLEASVKRGVPWAHLDIAGTARAASSKDEVTEGGTGVGVRTILAWLQARAG